MNIKKLFREEALESETQIRILALLRGLEKETLSPCLSVHSHKVELL